MFWQSVLLGLQTLSDGYIWVGIFGMMVVTFAWNALISLAMGSSESGVRSAAGCLLGTLGGVVVQALAVSFFVVVCLPIILFGKDFTPWAFITATATNTLLVGLKSLGIVLVLSLIPIIGQFISNTPGVTNFLQGFSSSVQY